MNRLLFRVLLGLVPLLIWSGGLLAAGDKPKAVPKKDPVEMAFTLPRGFVPTPEEAKFLYQVRAQLEPQLRDALDRVQNSTDKNEKLKAAKEVKQIRRQIRAAVYSVLQKRYAEAMKKEMERRKELAKKMAQQRKKHQQKHRHKQHPKKKKRR